LVAEGVAFSLRLYFGKVRQLGGYLAKGFLQVEACRVVLIGDHYDLINEHGVFAVPEGFVR